MYLAKRTCIIIHTWPINVADDLAKVWRTGKMNMLQHVTIVTRGGLTEVKKTIYKLFYIFAFIFILMSMV